MSHQKEWAAEDYTKGAFIQHALSTQLLAQYHFRFKDRDHWLDIGCGDGSFTLELAQEMLEGHVTGIDPSHKMIDFAKVHPKPANVVFKHQDVMRLADREKYTVVTAFWSLQWVSDIEKALENIYRALKPSGRFFAVFPSPNCLHNLLVKRVIESGRFSVLKHFQSPVHFLALNRCQQKADELGFHAFQAVYLKCRVKLPQLDVFRAFIQGIPFFEGQVPERDIPAIHEALIEAFEAYCAENFNGEYYFEDEVGVLIGMRPPRLVELMPEQREQIMRVQDMRGDLDTPRSQIKEALGDEAHLGSQIKPHEKFANQPTGDDKRLSQQTANNPDAQARADHHPELTPSPSLQAKNQAVARATPQMTPKPTAGG